MRHKYFHTELHVQNILCSNRDPDATYHTRIEDADYTDGRCNYMHIDSSYWKMKTLICLSLHLAGSVTDRQHTDTNQQSY
jgi:hypothetical protein